MSALARTAKPLLLAAALAGALLMPAAARADFGFEGATLRFADAGGKASMSAGSHPFAMHTFLAMNTEIIPEGGSCTEPFCELPEGEARNVTVDLPAGFVGDPYAVRRCSTAQFIERENSTPTCPNSSAVGISAVKIGFSPKPTGDERYLHVPLYNLVPPPGVAAKLGFAVLNVPVTIDFTINPDPPHNIEAHSTGISQAAYFYGSQLTVWGNPSDKAHDPFRGNCLEVLAGSGVDEPVSEGECPYGGEERAYITLPRSCGAPPTAAFEASAWNSGAKDSIAAQATDEAGEPVSVRGCGALGFGPEIEAAPTSRAASSPTGLDFALRVPSNEGLTDPAGRSVADIAKTIVTLPEGMTVNPSQASGLEVCSEADLARETPFSAPGAGCPQASKIGTIEVETPLLEDQVLGGALYVAEPYENPAGTLIALYVVISDRDLGIKIVQPLKVEPDPETGQLVTTAEDMPELPFSEFRLRFREGARSPLIAPPGCGEFEVEAELYPSTGGAPVESSSTFEVASGPGGGACPSGEAPFSPGFEAGTRNNAAGSYSPFEMRITRADGEQDITKFSSVLPPGVIARLAGVPWCPEAGIAQAKARTGQDGGRAEQRDPSCPAASQIGTTLAGAGAGSQLTHVPGTLHLAGPYNGAPLSVVAIVPAVAGPFDAGTVLVRVALRLNPLTGVAEADGAASDPIPHILQGIPLSVRELRVAVDRPQFTLNATSCAQAHTFATLWGGGTALSPRPDSPFGAAARYQAASCASLQFDPKLAIKLRGGVKRGAHPALRAVVTPKPGEANFSRAVVTLPRSAFLEQSHIRTICTRVQFAAGAGNGAACPPGSVYGKARAWSPLLDAPAEGPVFLRSSDNNLPDLVVALKGPASAAVDVELSARIDSVKGGIRSTFAGIPDLPVSRFILDMQGGQKGLIVNSRHLCFKPKRNRAKSNIRGQNGRFSRTRPRVIATTCAKRRKAAKRKRAKRSGARLARASTVR